MEAVLETVASIHRHGESLGELAHDARNMVTALSLYCDLLEEPGVLASAHHHYASELRLVAEGCRRLVEKLSLIDIGQEEAQGNISSRQGRLFPELAAPHGGLVDEPWSGGLIDDLRQELLSSQGLLAAIAGPAITVTTAVDGGAWPVRMSGENLIRALVNLVKNSADSMGGAGTIHVHLTERQEAGCDVPSLVLSVEDTGCGIPPEFLERIFDPGFSTHGSGAVRGGWVSGHRGLGLAITRSIVTAAGGRIHAANRAPQGTRFAIELPVRSS
jgi:signal transduction histidine kinase